MAYRTENPATGVVEKEYTSATDADVTRAIERADAAFGTWRTTDASERAAVLAKVADIYDERADELARVIGAEMGKPLAQAQGEVALASSIFRWYSEHGEELLVEEQLNIGDDAKSLVVTDPIGVLMGVMPWNFPHYQVARFVAPNLMLGNTILLKHASICARTAELIEEILHAAGVPQDAYINLFVSNEQITSIIEDPRVRRRRRDGEGRRHRAHEQRRAGLQLPEAHLRSVDDVRRLRQRRCRHRRGHEGRQPGRRGHGHGPAFVGRGSRRRDRPGRARRRAGCDPAHGWHGARAGRRLDGPRRAHRCHA